MENRMVHETSKEMLAIMPCRRWTRRIGVSVQEHLDTCAGLPSGTGRLAGNGSRVSLGGSGC